MTQIKIFALHGRSTQLTCDSAEREINDWLKENDVVVIGMEVGSTFIALLYNE